jgi:hypothetical protein
MSLKRVETIIAALRLEGHRVEDIVLILPPTEEDGETMAVQFHIDDRREVSEIVDGIKRSQVGTLRKMAETEAMMEKLFASQRYGSQGSYHGTAPNWTAQQSMYQHAMWQHQQAQNMLYQQAGMGMMMGGQQASYPHFQHPVAQGGTTGNPPKRTALQQLAAKLGMTSGRRK